MGRSRRRTPGRRPVSSGRRRHHRPPTTSRARRSSPPIRTPTTSRRHSRRARSPPLADAEHSFAHQFDDAEQQRQASSLGMWVFLVTEIMFFGGMFTAYAIYRALYPDAFAHGSHELDIHLGATNTAVLIVSSFTMALAVHAAQVGHRRRLVWGPLVPMALGTVFLVIKAFEYHEKFATGHVPGPYFTWPGPEASHVELFFALYFAMTGFHALHMVIGVGLLTWLVLGARAGRYGPGYHNPVEI